MADVWDIRHLYRYLLKKGESGFLLRPIDKMHYVLILYEWFYPLLY